MIYITSFTEIDLYFCDIPMTGFVRQELEVAYMLDKVLGFSTCS